MGSAEGKKRKGFKEFIHTYTRCVDNWEDYSYNSSSHAVYPRSGVMMRDGGGVMMRDGGGDDERWGGGAGGRF